MISYKVIQSLSIADEIEKELDGVHVRAKRLRGQKERMNLSHANE